MAFSHELVRLSYDFQERHFQTLALRKKNKRMCFIEQYKVVAFTVTFSWKFAIKLSLNIPPHLKRVATVHTIL